MLTFGFVKPNAQMAIDATRVASIATAPGATRTDGGTVPAQGEPGSQIPIYRKPWFGPAALGAGVLVAVLLRGKKKSASAARAPV